MTEFHKDNPPECPNPQDVEARRVAAVKSLNLREESMDRAYDDAVYLASLICGTPISLVTVLDETTQWFKAKIGVEISGMPKSDSFCAHTIRQQELLIVPDALLDFRFRNLSSVSREPHIRFYAGATLWTIEGEAVGTLCVLDYVPRELNEDQKNALMMLSRQVAARFHDRQKVMQLARIIIEKERVEKELQSSHLLFEAFMDHSPLVSFLKNASGQLVYYNRSFAESFAISRQAWIGKNEYEFFPKDVARRLAEGDRVILESDKMSVVEEAIPGPDGAIHLWKTYKFGFDDASGERFLAGLCHDITAEKKALEDVERYRKELRSSHALFEAFMDNSPLLSYMKNGEGRFVYYNRTFMENFGVSRSEWIGLDERDFFPAEDGERLVEIDREIFLKDELSVKETAVPGPDGARHIWKSYKFNFENASGERFLAALCHEITAEKQALKEVERYHTELRKANQKLRELSLTDPLTGCWNRRAFDERLASEFATCERRGGDFSMLLLDIDNFKRVNDTFGHDEGDRVLRRVAKVLMSSARETDLVCRFGGEEFAILLPRTAERGALLIAERLRATIEAQRDSCPVTVSIGISHHSEEIGNTASVIRRADQALYKAKAAGKNRVETAKAA